MGLFTDFLASGFGFFFLGFGFFEADRWGAKDPSPFCVFKFCTTSSNSFLGPDPLLVTSDFQCSLDPHLEKLDFLRAANSLEVRKSLKSASGMGYLVITRLEEGLRGSVLGASFVTEKLAHKELTNLAEKRRTVTPYRSQTGETHKHRVKQMWKKRKC